MRGLKRSEMVLAASEATPSEAKWVAARFSQIDSERGWSRKQKILTAFGECPPAALLAERSGNQPSTCCGIIKPKTRLPVVATQPGLDRGYPDTPTVCFVCAFRCGALAPRCNALQSPKIGQNTYTNWTLDTVVRPILRKIQKGG